MHPPIPLEFKRNSQEVLTRLERLWSRQAQDQVFAHIAIPSPALAEHADTHRDGPTDYPDPAQRIAFWETYLAEGRDLEDDWLPIAYLSEFDEGIYTAALGAQIEFIMHAEIGWVSSMSHPLLEDLNDLDQLRIDPSHPQLERMDRQVRLFAERAHGRFGVAAPIIIDALNFVAEARGATQAFFDVMDHPAQVVQLMDLAYDLNVMVQERIYAQVEHYAGGTFVNMGSWAPGRPILFSVDLYHMAQPDYYYTWGQPHIQRMLNHFGGGLLHLHSNGRHLLPHVCNLQGLVCVYLLDEKWAEPAIDHLPDYLRQADGVPLVVDCSWERFTTDLKTGALPGGVFYHVFGAPSVEEANRVMAEVKKYRWQEI